MIINPLRDKRCRIQWDVSDPSSSTVTLSKIYQIIIKAQPLIFFCNTPNFFNVKILKGYACEIAKILTIPPFNCSFTSRSTRVFFLNMSQNNHSSFSNEAVQRALHHKNKSFSANDWEISKENITFCKLKSSIHSKYFGQCSSYYGAEGSGRLIEQNKATRRFPQWKDRKCQKFEEISKTENICISILLQFLTFWINWNTEM